VRSSTSTQVVSTGHPSRHRLPAGDSFQMAPKKDLLLNNDEELPQPSMFPSHAGTPASRANKRGRPFKDGGEWPTTPQSAFFGFAMPHVCPLSRLLCLIGLTVLLAACAPHNQPLRIATHPWVGYESLCLAEDLGVLPPDTTLQHGGRAADTMAALRAGSVDAGTLTLDEMLTLRAAGTPLTAVLIFDSSSGADVLLVRRGIRRLADLAGKRIGYEPSAVGALVLSEVLAQADLSEGAVTRVELPLQEHLSAWRDGRVDAIVTYEPTAAQLQAEGATRLFDSRQMPDTIFDVLAMRADRLDGRPVALRKAIEAHFEMRAYINRNRDDAVYRIAAHQGVTAADVRRALGGVTVPDLGGNRYALQAGSRFDAAARRVYRLMTDRGMLTRPDALDPIYSAEFLLVTRAAPP
jgi:NitT/TauT family transport system substrate-binding protein